MAGRSTPPADMPTWVATIDGAYVSSAHIIKVAYNDSPDTAARVSLFMIDGKLEQSEDPAFFPVKATEDERAAVAADSASGDADRAAK